MMRSIQTVVLSILASSLVRSAEAQSQLFPEASPITSIPGLANGPNLVPINNPATGSAMFCYAPTLDIGSPEFGVADGEAHPAQMLTVFWPIADPEPGQKFPALMYSTAAVFMQGPSSETYAFLAEALADGWCVITVGSVGHNSWPTCKQAVECTDPSCECNLDGSSSCGGLTLCNVHGQDPGCASHPSGCWDPNLFYAPGSDPWNDFNYFYGEKDFTWARQYVAENADMLHVDNVRVVVCGTSTGAFYAGFVAYGPDRAWADPDPLDEFDLSAQSTMDTRVAGMVAFEPVVWIGAVPPQNPGGSTFRGLHWAEVDDPLQAAYRQLDNSVADIPDSLLVADSISRWIRTYDPKIPTFVASGDGSPFFTGFGRDGNDFPNDYARYAVPSGAFIAGDPLVEFPSLPDPLLRLHDAWNALVWKEDLENSVDQMYHQRHSRLYLREDINWDSWPGSKTYSGVPPDLEDPDLEDLYFINGTYTNGGVTTPLGSVSNPDLAHRITNWMNNTFCAPGYTGVFCRSLGNNFRIYSGSTMAIGQTAEATVFMNECPEVYEGAWIFGYHGTAQTPMANGEFLLCADNGSGELLDLPVKTKGPSGIVTFTFDVPNDPNLIGEIFYTQGQIYDYQGIHPTALTNAQDYVIQP